MNSDFLLQLTTLFHFRICLMFFFLQLFIPNRTFLVRFGGISGEFGRAMVRILARRSQAKILMVRPNELDMLPKRTKKGAIRYLPYPNSSYNPAFFFFFQ